MISYILVLFMLVCGLGMSCNNTPTTADSAPDKLPVFDNTQQHTIKSMAWLAGIWATNTPPTIMERWSVVSENHLQGEGFKVSFGVNRGYQTTEYLNLRTDSKGVYYEATAIGQNNNEPIKFHLTAVDTVLGYQFTNPKHDFPNLIAYKPYPKDSLLITVGTLQPDGKRFTVTLHKQSAETIEMLEDVIREGKQDS